jgi:hypothetical protein
MNICPHNVLIYQSPTVPNDSTSELLSIDFNNFRENSWHALLILEELQIQLITQWHLQGCSKFVRPICAAGMQQLESGLFLQNDFVGCQGHHNRMDGVHQESTRI